MKKLVIVASILLSAVALAQSLLRDRRMYRPQLLEPLLPFAEAVEKAKAGNPQGYYALAIHYAKGEAIERDDEQARQFLRKASDLNYGNAVLIDTICLEQSSVTKKEMHFSAADLKPYCHDYAGIRGLTPFSYERGKHSLTNSADVAAIRAGYKRAFRLGVAAATNELARFEQRLESVRAEAKRRLDEVRQKIDNAALAKSLFEMKETSLEETVALRKRLNDPDADDDRGRTFTWTVGGKEGVTIDVLIRAKQEEGRWHYLEKATITIDKDGRIIKIEGKPGRTEIQS